MKRLKSDQWAACSYFYESDLTTPSRGSSSKAVRRAELGWVGLDRAYAVPEGSEVGGCVQGDISVEGDFCRSKRGSSSENVFSPISPLLSGGSHGKQPCIWIG